MGVYVKKDVIPVAIRQYIKNFLGSEKAKSHLKNLNIHSWY
ncbi:MAG TPA: hypothetical protein PLI22_03300 [Caldisericia bacterium]|nr:hypothetical protein [Caldisericia bacterium]